MTKFELYGTQPKRNFKDKFTISIYWEKILNFDFFDTIKRSKIKVQRAGRIDVNGSLHHYDGINFGFDYDFPL